MASRWWPIRRSVTMIFRQPRSQAGAAAAEDRRRAWRLAAPGRAGFPDPRDVGVRDSKGLERGACRRQRRRRRARARQGRDRSARQGVSARTETARPADAVNDCGDAATFLTKCFTPESHAIAASARANQRISASCFRALSNRCDLSFFRASPDSIILPRFEFNRDPASRRSRQAGQRVPLPLPEKKSAARSRAGARRSAVPRHRADPGLDGVSRHLRCDREISVGDTALDRDRLDPVSGVRADHGAGDAAGFAALCACKPAASVCS